MYPDIQKTLRHTIQKLDATDTSQMAAVDVQWLVEQRFIAQTILDALENDRIVVNDKCL